MIYTQASVTTAFSRLSQGQTLARSLAGTRYVDFPNGQQDKEWRRRNAEAMRCGSIEPRKLTSWRSFALSLAGVDGEKSPRLLFARQMSRLMVGMAGGVFENGGLTLDRLSGIPTIPGSAVKGCARRAILAPLQEWTHGVLKPRDAANPLSPLIDGFKEPADLLIEIAVIFGWSDLEWQSREDFRSDKEWEEKRPDFAWACGEKWQATRQTVAERLCARFCITPNDANKPWKSLPHFAGTISFLPAYPWDKDPGIDLDVITCHHGDYYKNEDPNAVASDTEEPVPVIFPAVRPGQTWCFLLHPTNRAAAADLPNARRWLAHGLEIFGIGAKTNAGYGWFAPLDGNSSERAQLAREKTHQMALAAQSRHQAAMQRKSEELAEKKQRDDQKARDDKAADDAAKTADEWSAEYSALTEPEKIANLIKAFDAMTENQRLGFLRVLASSDHKKRRKQWLEHPDKQKFIHAWQTFGKMHTPPVNI